MKLSDAVGHAGLSTYTEIALVIFFVAFVGIVAYTFARRNRDKYDQASHMPLDDDTPVNPRGAEEGALR
ncbi:MAG: cbb3-type cytochrome c oxidase subunit 3 [Myxococcales bacterium]|nr:cbb3-type cytochrome c oxidase subunit 3 [Myxococcales bacterium]